MVLFVGMEVDVQFHELTIYDEGTCFDWHRNLTHKKNHHVTVLVVPNTSWLGNGF